MLTRRSIYFPGSETAQIFEFPKRSKAYKLVSVEVNFKTTGGSASHPYLALSDGAGQGLGTWIGQAVTGDAQGLVTWAAGCEGSGLVWLALATTTDPVTGIRPMIDSTLPQTIGLPSDMWIQPSQSWTVLSFEGGFPTAINILIDEPTKESTAVSE